MGIIRDVATVLLERKREALNSPVLTGKVRQYRRVLKTSAVEMAAIEKFNPNYKVFEKFNFMIVKNFFKYRGFMEATRVLMEEAVEPWLAASLLESTITTDNVASCEAGNCSTELQEAERHLIAPMELFKMRETFRYA